MVRFSCEIHGAFFSLKIAFVFFPRRFYVYLSEKKNVAWAKNGYDCKLAPTIKTIFLRFSNFILKKFMCEPN